MCYKVQSKEERCWRASSATWLCGCCTICCHWWRHLGIPALWTQSPSPRERPLFPAASPLRENQTVGREMSRDELHTAIYTASPMFQCSSANNPGDGAWRFLRQKADLTLVFLQTDCPQGLLGSSQEHSKGLSPSHRRIRQERFQLPSVSDGTDRCGVHIKTGATEGSELCFVSPLCLNISSLTFPSPRGLDPSWKQLKEQWSSLGISSSEDHRQLLGRRNVGDATQSETHLKST